MGEIEQFVVLLIATAVVTVAALWLRVHYTLALLVLGLALGISNSIPTPALSSEVILLLLLPPILFEAAFLLDLRLLWANRRGVLTLALPGVLLATAVGGVVTHLTTPFPWDVALLFGAMVAATDPIAVVATLRRLRVDKRLSILLEGESLLNDGIALVLFATLVQAVEGDIQVWRAVLDFPFSVIVGTAVGVFAGLLGHLLIGLADEHLVEMTVSVAVAYGAFLGAEELHASGVFATLAAGASLSYLGRTRGWVYSGGSEQVLADLWEFLAFGANAALFLMMGLAVRLLGHPGYVLSGIVAALIGRAAVAYGLGAALGRFGFPLTMTERHVVYWAGLRGAVALAAALSLPSGFPYRSELQAMTYGVVVFTLLVQGLTIGPLVRRLGLRIDDPAGSSRGDPRIPA